MSIGRKHGTGNAAPVISTRTMTAPQLAELIGCEVQTIRRWRTGKRRLGHHYLRRIEELDAELAKPRPTKTISPAWAGRCPAFRPRYADDEPRGRMAHAGD